MKYEMWSSSVCLCFTRHRKRLTLYNLKFGLEISYSVVYHSGLAGRMKILRGDLIVSYRPSRSRVHIVNYRTGAIAWLDGVPHSPSVRAMLSLLLSGADI